jgi:periplasmic protein CpxP/Spy
MTKMKKIIGMLALVAALAATAMVGFAQDGPAQGGRERGERRGNREGKRGGHDGIGLGRFARNLNLSDAQKEQMQQIAARHREATRSLREQMHAQRKGEFGGFGDGTFNESAVRQAAQARAQIEVELEVARARMMSEMYNVLTPEQKTQLAQEREQRKQRINERRARRNAVTPDDNQ